MNQKRYKGTGMKMYAAAMLLVCIVCLCACGKKKPQSASLTLPSNPTTGYSWTVTQSEELFDISSEFISSQDGTAEPGLAGVGGVERFVLTPKAAGKTELSFAYERSWENVEPEEALSWELEVDKQMQIKIVSFAGALSGTMDELPELPELIIE